MNQAIINLVHTLLNEEERDNSNAHHNLVREGKTKAAGVLAAKNVALGDFRRKFDKELTKLPAAAEKPTLGPGTFIVTVTGTAVQHSIGIEAPDNRL